VQKDIIKRIIIREEKASLGSRDLLNNGINGNVQFKVKIGGRSYNVKPQNLWIFKSLNITEEDCKKVNSL
jgi:hypothetical protein